MRIAHARRVCSTDCSDVHGAQTAKHKASEASHNGAASPAEVDLAADRHRGQFALRKLYHESERLVVVLYTSPGCGPCRTLKPIFSKVVDEYSGKVGPCAVTLGIWGSMSFSIDQSRALRYPNR